MGRPATQSGQLRGNSPMKHLKGLKLDQEGAASYTQVHHMRAGQPQTKKKPDRKFKPIKDTDTNKKA